MQGAPSERQLFWLGEFAVLLVRSHVCIVLRTRKSTNTLEG